MTQKEYVEKKASILAAVPEELREALYYDVLLTVRSLGDRAVLNNLSGLVDALKQPLKNYAARIAKEAKQSQG